MLRKQTVFREFDIPLINRNYESWVKILKLVNRIRVPVNKNYPEGRTFKIYRVSE